jgi:hypothetical protein
MVRSPLHEAAEKGDSDTLKVLLSSGSYDVNERDDRRYLEGVGEAEREGREREQKSLLLSSVQDFSYEYLTTLSFEKQMVCERGYSILSMSIYPLLLCRLLFIGRLRGATASVPFFFSEQKLTSTQRR